MYSLKPFSAEKLNFALEADLRITGNQIQLEYSLSDQNHLFHLPKQAQKWSSRSIAREDYLWKTTCFEAFLNPVELPLYFELNFSLKPAWNSYVFKKYRDPQPPVPSLEFVLDSLDWDPFESRLRVQIENRTNYKKFNVGLTAVLEERTGVKHYCALAHKGSQPDFHLIDSFNLIR